jgi:hypothetical protein
MIQLRRVGRFSKNLQTIAVVLVAIHDTLYLIHCRSMSLRLVHASNAEVSRLSIDSLDPFGPGRGRLDTAMLSYLPAPVCV